MRAVRVHEVGGPERLTVEEIERPEPGDDELLVEVASAGVNPVDTYFREGTYAPVGLPFTPGCDVAGEVVEAGAGVEGLAVGDAVVGTSIGNGAYQGAYAEYAVLPADRAVALPDGVDPLAAGAAGTAATTAWYALVTHAGLEPAEWCLVHGGSGGVGHAAVQVAAAVDARVVATAAPAYHEAVADLGAEVVLDYGREDLADAVVEATGGGVDVVLDHRMDDYLQLDGDVARPRGRVVGIGQNRPDPAFADISAVRRKDLVYRFVSTSNAPDVRTLLRGVAHLMAVGDLRVEVARTYDLDEAAEAHRAVMEDSFLGKLAIVP